MSGFWKKDGKEDKDLKSRDAGSRGANSKESKKKDSKKKDSREEREQWNENAIKTLLEAEKEAEEKLRGIQNSMRAEYAGSIKQERTAETEGTREAEDTRYTEDTREAEDTGYAEDTREAEDTRYAEDTREAEDTRYTEDTGEAGDTRYAEDTGKAEDIRDTEDTGEAGSTEDAQGTEDTISPLLDERILRAIKDMGFEKFSPIQEQAIPYLLRGEDIIGQAQTGTGKTAAFGIPAIMKIDPENKALQTIILCPTRELAIQAAEEIRKLAKYMNGTKVLPVYGGQEISRQIKGLKGTQIIVGTPGRVMDHMRRRTIKLDDINMVVLDEADEMLNMGFREDMETILGQIPNEHQTALFSATMPKPILDITNQFQKDAKLIKVAAKELTIPLVSQKYYRIKSKDKDAACIRLLEYYQPKLALIFCNTKHKVDEVAEVLKKNGFQAEGLHGDMSQRQRDVAMGRFRNGSTNILIATDVAARGIDVDDVEAVINYDIPQDIEYYVHRIGRTGRAGRRGRSFTFVSGREIFQLRDIERICHTTVEEKKLPGASKVLKTKADKYLSQAWELHENEDMELMKKFLERKMEEEECDALDLAAAMLKLQVGDRAEEIQVDDYTPKKKGEGRSRGGRSGRRSSGRELFGGREGRDRGGRGRGDRDGFGGRDDRDRESRRDRSGRDEGRSRKDGFGGRDDRDRESRRDRSGRDEGRSRKDSFGGREGRDRKERDSRKDRRDGASRRRSEEGSGKSRSFGDKGGSGRKSYFMSYD